MFDNYRDMLTISEIAEALKIGRNNAYELVRSGAIRSVKIGRQYRVSKASLYDFIKEGNPA